MHVRVLRGLPPAHALVQGVWLRRSLWSLHGGPTQGGLRAGCYLWADGLVQGEPDMPNEGCMQN